MGRGSGAVKEFGYVSDAGVKAWEENEDTRTAPAARAPTDTV